MLDPTAARAAKEDGQQIALEFAGDWAGRVLEELGAWIASRRQAGVKTMTFEEFRAVARNVPERHQAWGTLPKLAVRQGLIAPMEHEDGSPVVQFSKSVKTHRHPIRVWRLLGGSFSCAAGTESPSKSHHAPEAGSAAPQQEKQPMADLVRATADYHAGRAALGGLA